MCRRMLPWFLQVLAQWWSLSSDRTLGFLIGLEWGCHLRRWKLSCHQFDYYFTALLRKDKVVQSMGIFFFWMQFVLGCKGESFPLQQLITQLRKCPHLLSPCSLRISAGAALCSELLGLPLLGKGLIDRVTLFMPWTPPKMLDLPHISRCVPWSK